MCVCQVKAAIEMKSKVFDMAVNNSFMIFLTNFGMYAYGNLCKTDGTNQTYVIQARSTLCIIASGSVFILHGSRLHLKLT
jgi:hypothetical protein